jgi:ParB/RepB/Spo0J family partition protein
MRAEVAERVYRVPLRQIHVSDDNVRHTQADKDLQELADSIREHGQLQPIMLRGPEDAEPPYEVIVGQRRFLAYRRILQRSDPDRWGKIEAVFGGNLGKWQVRVRSLAENMQRVQLSYKDAADAITELYEHFNRNERRVAEATGISLGTVRKYIYIESQSTERVRRLLREKKVKAEDAKRALRAAQGDGKKAEQILDIMQRERLTGHEKSRLVDFGRSHPDADPKSIVQESMKPRLEVSILVNLEPDVKRALDRAVKALRLGPEEVVAQAVDEWLADRGFK